MKQYSKKLFSIAMLLSTAAVTANVAPYLQFRSQGRNTARKVVNGTSFYTDLYDQDSWYGLLDLTLEYDRSFRPQNITDALFGADVLNLSNVTTTTNNRSTSSMSSSGGSIVVSGSELPNRAATDWMAENFLLPRNFRSIMTFSPLVQNILLNFDWYMGLDNWCGGLYFRVYGPVVNNRNSLRFSETPISAGSNDEAGFTYDPGFFNFDGVAVDQLFKSAGAFFSGAPLANQIEGTTFNPLRYGKFQTTGHRSKTGFAELRAEFGWNYLQERWRAGLNLQIAAPTGTRVTADYVLPPVIGNGKHWELGVGLKGLWSMWRSEDEEKHFDFIIEADITHLFKAKQTRTFDLVGKPNSRYMLAQKLNSTAGRDQHLNGDVEFDGEYGPVANISTRNVNVSIGVQGDVVAMFNYTARGFTWDLGYNFWGMSREKISLSSSSLTTSTISCNAILPFPANTWALKGDASTFGQATVNGRLEPVGLAATESNATIHAGTNGNVDNANTNPNIDSPTDATVTPGDISVFVVGEGSTTPINTSETPVFIREADLDLNGARMRGYSNKIFTNFGYAWTNMERWSPFIGIGASGEFGSHSRNGNNNGSISSSVSNNNNGSGNSGTNFGLSQWAIWLKGGVAFH